MDRLAHLQKMLDRHGDVFTIRPLNGAPSVVVSDPDLIKQIFTAPAAVLDSDECNREALGWLLGEYSLFLLDAKSHIRHRRMLLPPLHGDRLEGNADAMRALTDRHLADWCTGEAIPTLPRLRALTLDVVLEAIFGSCEDGVGRALRDVLPAPVLMANAGNAPATRVTLQPVHALVRKEIGRRRAEAQTQHCDDVLSYLLATRYEDGSQLSDAEVCDELLTLIAAGTGATANSLAWVLERLARATEPLERAAAEARMGGGPYLTAAIYEAMRMRPAVPILARLVKQPFRMGEHSISPGTIVAPCSLLVHHRDDIYPDPMSFRPERFLNRQPGTYTWMPFGGGVRRCIGSNFALLEMRVILATLLSQMTPRAVREEPEQMLHQGNAMIPADRASLVFEPAGSR